jgi:two-component system, OmpR family, sensor kinase
MRITSIRTKLTLWSVLVQALVLVLLSVILRYSVQANRIGSIDRELTWKTDGHQSMWARISSERRGWGPGEPGGPVDWDERRRLGGPGEGGAPPPLGPDWPERGPGAPLNGFDRNRRRPEPIADPMARFRPRAFDLAGQPARSGPGGMQQDQTPWDKAGFAEAVKGKSVTRTVASDDEDGPIRVRSAPLLIRGEITGVVQAAYPLGEVNRGLVALTFTILILAPVALLISAVGSAFLADRMVRPVKRITEAASTIGAHDLSARLQVAGNDELSRLASTFNDMLARLEQSFEQQRRFTADASHELRTPLTAIKGYTSLALHSAKTVEDYRRALEGSDRAATLMSRIVQDLLLLARADAGQLTLDVRTVGVADVVETAAGMLEGRDHPEIDTSGIDRRLCVAGDPAHLIRLFTNLLDNAVRHTPADGRITVRAGVRDDEVTVSVADTGSGIAPEHLPHLMERFYRVDDARARAHGGTGLGLPICQSIVEAHGGRMEIQSEVGNGTTVLVTLPSASVEDARRSSRSEVLAS